MTPVFDPGTANATVPESPSARRLDTRRWKDPRLWVGLVLVAGSVLVGVRVLAAADDTIGVWAVTRDVPQGTPLTADLLSLERVHFADAAAAARYQLEGDPVPESSVATRDLAAGELLPGSAVGERDAADLAHLPVVVGAGGAPGDLAAGDLVDLWVVPPERSNAATPPARRLLTDVRVVRTAREAGPLGDAATRQVLLGLLESDVELGSLLTAVTLGTVVLVRSGS
jgi:hypothetical protein